MFVLIVTWLTFNQPPSTTQTAFTSPAKCEAARRAILGQEAGIKADLARQVAEAASHGAMYNPGPAPQVSVVCVAR
jgi:hypothetical protein